MALPFPSLLLPVVEFYDGRLFLADYLERYDALLGRERLLQLARRERGMLLGSLDYVARLHARPGGRAIFRHAQHKDAALHLKVSGELGRKVAHFDSEF